MNETMTNSGGVATAESTRGDQFYRSAVDIVEDASELRILADMPGVSAESIEIDFEDGVLTVLGRVPRRRDESTKYLWEEYGVGDFRRTFRIGETVDPTRISAEYAEGVLTVHLPKVEAAKPRKITVQTK
jgi:HSP20 family protein